MSDLEKQVQEELPRGGAEGTEREKGGRNLWPGLLLPCRAKEPACPPSPAAPGPSAAGSQVSAKHPPAAGNTGNSPWVPTVYTLTLAFFLTELDTYHLDTSTPHLHLSEDEGR